MIAFFLLLIFAVLSGIIDGILWSRKGADAFKSNEHVILFAERIAIFALAYFSAPLLLIISAALLFSFFHNGTYYETRNYIDNNTYPLGFWSEPSSGSTASINFTLKQRTTLLCIGFVFFILHFIIN